MRFIAFDLETTGIMAGVDRIVEIGAVRFIDGAVEGVFSTLVDPLIPIPPGATKVNGITDDMVKGKLRVEELLESFAEFCADDVLIAHNAEFDYQFLVSDIKKHESKAPKGLVLDSYPMAKKVFPGLANYRLSTLVQHLSIPSTGFHRAEEDATYCGHVLLKMIDKISGAPRVWPPVANLVALTGRLEMRFPQIIPQPKQLNLLDLL
jgi:DNA polymerase-3 subunit epsilon